MKGLIFIYIMTYGGSLVALFQPFVGLCIYYCFAVLNPVNLWFYATTEHDRYSLYVAGATLLGWGLRGFSRGGPHKEALPIILTLAGFVLVVNLSAWMAFDPIRAEEIASSMFKIALIFYVGFCLMDSAYRLKVLLWTYILSQGYLAFEMNLQTLLTGQNIIVVNDGFGALNNNTFALSLLPGIALALMTSIFERRLLLRGLSLFSALASLHVVLLSESRGGYLGLIVILVLAFYFMPKNRTTVPVFLFGLVIACYLVGEPVQKEFMTMFADKLDDSAAGRFDKWSGAFQVMKDYPLLGVGPNNFGLFSGNFSNVEAESAAHNLYLQTAADCGIPGLLLLVSFYFITLRRLFHMIQWNSEAMFMMDPLVASVTTGAFAGLVGYLTHSFFSAGVVIETPYLTALLGAAAIRLYCSKANEAVQEKVPAAALTNA